MKQILLFSLYDFKQIFRDKMLIIFLFAPFLLLAFIRFAVPVFLQNYPVLQDYQPYIMMFGAMQTAIMFGFINSFLLLEEKDENVLQALRVLPMNTFFFIAYRLFFGTLFSFFGALLLLNTSGIAQPTFVQSIFLAAQYALVAPLIALVVATFAKNKIEGLAFFKGVDLVLLLPILSFFIPSVFQYLFAVIPVYWTFHLYDSFLANADYSWAWLLGGFLVYGLALVVMSVLFKKRVFDV